HLAAPDPTRVGRGHDGVHHLFRHDVVGDHLDPGLGHEVDGVLGPAVDLRVPLLTSVALDLADGHAQHAELFERRAHVVQRVRFHDRGDQLHDALSSNFPAGTGFGASIGGVPVSTDAALPPRAPAKSYADSACSASSMPATSASALTRPPVTALTNSPSSTEISAE